MHKLLWAQFIVLLLGVVFAWVNFTIGLISWWQKRLCTFQCTTGLVNPFLTPCFYGALFFSLAFILSILILTRERRK